MPVTRSHIASVIADPELFGVTREYIERVYKAYGEPLGWEGVARERVIKELIARGFIRIRDYTDYVSIQTFSLNEHGAVCRLLAFFQAVQFPPWTEVRLGLLAEQKTETITVADLQEQLVMMADSEEQG